MDDIAVLIPCYNEDKTIEKVVSDFKRVLPDADIYVYDNNSTDDTEKNSLDRRFAGHILHRCAGRENLDPAARADSGESS